MLSWYEMNGQSMETFWKVILQSMYGSLVHRRNNGAVVMIAMDYATPMELPRTMEQLNEFVQAIVPSVKAVLPSTARGWL